MMQGEAVESCFPAGAGSAAPANSTFLATNSTKKREAALRRHSLVFAALALSFSSLAFSQGRTIEETLVVKDPTVAAPGNWLFGAALEYMYVKGAYDLYDSNGDKIADGDISFGLPGANVWVGYGNLTVNFAYRKGSGEIDRKWTNGALSIDKLDQKDTELTLRYLFRTGSGITPYVIGGYLQTKFDEDETITNAGYIFPYNNSTRSQRSTTYNSPMLGGGAIFPFSDKFGARADVRLTYSSAEVTYDTGQKFTGSGIGGGFTATGYWNITDFLNAQLGIKYQSLNGGDLGYKNMMGLFAMLGVTVR
jgi:hypothetical protein